MNKIAQPLTKLQPRKHTNNKKHILLNKIRSFNIPSLFQIIIQFSYQLRWCYQNKQLLYLSEQIFMESYNDTNPYVLYDVTPLVKNFQQKTPKKGHTFHIFGFQTVGSDLLRFMMFYYPKFREHSIKEKKFYEPLNEWAQYIRDNNLQQQLTQVIFNKLQKLKIYLSFSYLLKIKNTSIGVRLKLNSNKSKKLNHQISLIQQNKIEKLTLLTRKQSIHYFIKQSLLLIYSAGLILIYEQTVENSKPFKQDNQESNIIKYIVRVHDALVQRSKTNSCNTQNFKIENQNIRILLRKSSKNQEQQKNSQKNFQQNDILQIMSFYDNFELKQVEQIVFNLKYQKQHFPFWIFTITLAIPYKICPLYTPQLEAAINKLYFKQQFSEQFKQFSILQESNDKVYIQKQFKVTKQNNSWWTNKIMDQIIKSTDYMIIFYLAIEPLCALLARKTNFDGPKCISPIQQCEQKSVFNDKQYKNICQKLKIGKYFYQSISQENDIFKNEQK